MEEAGMAQGYTCIQFGLQAIHGAKTTAAARRLLHGFPAAKIQCSGCGAKGARCLFSISLAFATWPRFTPDSGPQHTSFSRIQPL
jgi:hypothetical protein